MGLKSVGLSAVGLVLAAVQPALAEAPKTCGLELTAPGQKGRPLSVGDMLRYAEVGDPMTTTWGVTEAKPGLFSPSGARLAVILRNGEPENKRTVGRILLYRADRLLEDPEPRCIAQFASASNAQPISFMKWADETTLVFAGARGDDLSQIYSVDVETGELARLTDEKTQILWYDFNRRANRAAMTVAYPEPTPPDKNPTCLERGCRVTASYLWDAMQGALPFQTYSGHLVVQDIESGERFAYASPAQIDSDIERCFRWLAGSLSPNGRYALQLCRRRAWPDWWTRFADWPELTRNLEAGNRNFARSYYLYDLQEKSVRRLVEGPVISRSFAAPVWIDDGEKLILTDVLQRPGVGEDASWSILEIDLKSREQKTVAALDSKAGRVLEARWDTQLERLSLLFRKGRDGPAKWKSWRRRGKTWISIDPGDAIQQNTADTPVLLELRQSLNERPRLFARNIDGGSTREVLDPNPWLDDVMLGHVKQLNWADKTGRTWLGHLYYPVGYNPEERYPVVLQTHGVLPEKFSLNGYSTNYAAQPLAGRGMFVLQIAEVFNISDVAGTPEEWAVTQRAYESAIEFLKEEDLIDPERVGILGWSRTGNYVGHFLTHSDVPIAAAMLMDTNDFGWWNYLSWGVHKEIEVDYDAAPFGTGLENWLEIAPSFNINRVRAPVLMWQTRVVSELWDWYAALKRLDIPVEYWYLPDGKHELIKTSHQQAMANLLVDWFTFWLQGEESSDAKKVEQYKRWRDFREQKEELLITPRPPLLDWEAKPISD